MPKPSSPADPPCLDDYSFAIEVEMAGVEAQTARDALQRHDSNPIWAIRDIGQPSTGDMLTGFSCPVLKGEAGTTDLRFMLERLARVEDIFGTRAVRLHVHMSWDWTPAEVLKVLSSCIRSEFMADIQTYGQIPFPGLEIDEQFACRLGVSAADLVDRQSEIFRFIGLAEVSYVTVGATLFRDPLRTWMEFRQHVGTTCPNKIEKWIRCLAWFISNSRNAVCAKAPDCPGSTYKASREQTGYYPEIKELFSQAEWTVKCGSKRNRKTGWWWFTRSDCTDMACLHFSWLDWFYYEGALAAKSGRPCRQARYVLRPEFIEFFVDLVGIDAAKTAFSKIGVSDPY